MLAIGTRILLFAVTLQLSACSGSPPPLAGGTGGTVTSGGTTALQLTGGQTSGGAPALGGTGNSLGGSGGCDGTPTLGTVTPQALETELSQTTHSFLLINVHTPLAGNIPGTDADIVYTDVPAIEAFIGPDKSKPVVVYCMTNHMATIAGPALVTDGYCNVRYLDGGLSAWEAAGYPVDP